MNTKVGRFTKRGMDDLDKCTKFLNIENQQDADQRWKVCQGKDVIPELQCKKELNDKLLTYKFLWRNIDSMSYAYNHQFLLIFT